MEAVGLAKMLHRGRHKSEGYSVFHADCLNVLRDIDTDSVASLVSDPPAGISFMGKDWDHHKGGRDEWIKWLTEVMRECYRVLKPGAHGLVWALPRTSHWTATALEDAGFEVRDVITHLFGTGFPKSMDISKAIDATILHGSSHSRAIKKALDGREVTGTKLGMPGKSKGQKPVAKFTAVDRGDGKTSDGKDIAAQEARLGLSIDEGGHRRDLNVTKPTTPEAAQWQGWGTALKPASEHWILVRKPCSEKTVAANVLKHGTGGINIDASRIGTEPAFTERKGQKSSGGILNTSEEHRITSGGPGRFPANLVLDEEAAAALDEQSGLDCGAAAPVRKKATPLTTNIENIKPHTSVGDDGKSFRGDSGGASRFFYVAKASKADKGAGNTHPTVKSTALMAYLIKLVTPEGGLVLDPFMGSGSTGVAALSGGFKFVGVDKEMPYVKIALKRIKGVKRVD